MHQTGVRAYLEGGIGAGSMSLNPEVGAHGSPRPEDDQGAAGLWKVLLALMVRLTLAPAPVQQANAASRWPADRAQSAGGRAYRRVDLPMGPPGRTAILSQDRGSYHTRGAQRRVAD